MKKILILAVALSLSGCFYQEVSGYEVSLAVSYCKDKGGVETVTSWSFGSVTITCKGMEGQPSVTVSTYALIEGNVQ